MKSGTLLTLYASFLGVTLSLGACSQEPVATTYKKSVQSGAAPAGPGTGDLKGTTPAPGPTTPPATGSPTTPPAGGAGADPVAAGKLFFTSKNCVSCHGPEGKLATAPLSGLPYDEPALGVAMGASPSHTGIWPAGNDIKNLLAFFATLPP